MANARVIVIGGGFGGINAAKALNKAPVDVLVIDKTNHHLFQPLLYQVAAAALSAENIAVPIREVLRYQTNAAVLMADVISVDKQNNQIVFSDNKSVSFDYLICAVGAMHSYFGHPEWEEQAPGLKTLQDAISIRERILLAFEHAERCDDSSEAEKYLRFVIIGGGPTGVEMAGAIAEIARKTLFNNFRKIKPEQSKIYLIEGLPEILPSFPAELAAHARHDLEKLGVEVLTDTFVTNITADGVYMQDAYIETPNVIWAAGNAASPLLKTLDTPLDRQGRALVLPDLSIPGHSNIFVIGDAAALQDTTGKWLPGIAPAAIQQGRYVAELIRKKIAPEERKPFVYFDKGNMATIGKAKAIATVGKFQITGYLAWLAWCFIHILYLISFRNRILVMIQWMFWYVSGKRQARLISRPIDDIQE